MDSYLYLFILPTAHMGLFILTITPVRQPPKHQNISVTDGSNTLRHLYTRKLLQYMNYLKLLVITV